MPYSRIEFHRTTPPAWHASSPQVCENPRRAKRRRFLLAWSLSSLLGSFGRSRTVTVFEKCHDNVQLFDSGFKFADSIGYQLLRLRQFIAVFQRFILQPLESIELELSFLHFADVKFAPAVFLRVFGLTFRPAVWISA